jgi:multiple sugar transport system substrate-binding protein
MKQFLVMMVALLLVSGLAFATGQGEESTPEEEITLKYYVQIPSDHDPAIEQVIEKYQETNPTVTVEYEHLSDGTAEEYLQRLDLLMLSGEHVDVVTQPGPSDHFERASNGMLAALDPYIEAEGIEYDDVYTTRHEVDGNIYALPAYVGTWYVLINKDHLDSAGLELPAGDWTWAEYREYARALTTDVDGQVRYGSYMHNWPMFNYAGMWSAKEDNPLFYEDGSLALEHEAFKGFVQFRRELESDGYQMPYDVARADNVHYLGGFFNERFSMQVIGSWTINAVRRLEKFPHDFVVTFASLPRWDEDTPARRTFSENAYYAIAEGSEHKGEAYEFIRLITTYGAPLIAKGFSAEKGADNGAILAGMMQGHEELYDVDALADVINNRVDNPTTYFPEYQAAVEEVMQAETEKYLFGGYNFDEWLENVTTRAQDAIDNY